MYISGDTAYPLKEIAPIIKEINESQQDWVVKNPVQNKENVERYLHVLQLVKEQFANIAEEISEDSVELTLKCHDIYVRTKGGISLEERSEISALSEIISSCDYFDISAFGISGMLNIHFVVDDLYSEATQ